MARKERGGSPRTIDWDEVRRRLAAATESLNRELEPAEEETILRSRARALAQEPPKDEAGERLEILEFLLAHETYGVEMRFVRETRPLRDFTPLPCTPPFVLGLINVRGQILSVVDIRRFFDLPDKGLTDLNKVIVVHDGPMVFGVLADDIRGVRTVPVAELTGSLPTLTGVREEYLKGVTGEGTVVLEWKKILSDSRIVVHEEV